MEKKRKGSIAQREEETELHAPLCLNNCGFPGSPATDSACSPGSAPSIWSPGSATPADGKGGEGTVEGAAVAVPPVSREVNRCLLCRKRLGLMGFRCRCGDLFCGEHRYSDRHGCGFDYKAAARAAIARANPVVRAAKIARI